MFEFPDSNVLSNCLSTILQTGSKCEILSRESFIQTSTSPVELIICKTGVNIVKTLFCKYDGRQGDDNYDHRIGLEYEAKIYADVLSNMHISKINYYGFGYLDNNESLLVLEYMEDVSRIDSSEDDDVLPKAAEWIGKFHHLGDGLVPDFIKIYDKEHYTSWVVRFKELTSNCKKDYPIIERIIKFFLNNLSSLLTDSQTIIHGEYYPKNILIKDGVIYPVDWESAAVGAGEIDLVCLTEGWENDDVEKAKEIYKTARWPAGGDMANIEFELRLLMADIYFMIRWWPDYLTSPSLLKDSNRYQELQEVYERAIMMKESNIPY
ncbi:MAG: hypothetical protein NVSMB45_18530 [Ginsengibacter sp.]